jgi:UDP-N-acetylmuramate-alanine ligase
VVWSVPDVGIGAAAGASWRQHGDRVGLAALAVVAAALAVVLTVRTVRSKLNVFMAVSRRAAESSP